MSFAAPWFAWAAGGVALATAALHLLAWRRPPESPLPTARFAPERPIRMVSRAVRPTDLALLALRVVLVLLVGAALAGPTLDSRREGTARVIVVDRSRDAGAGSDVANAARSAFRSGDALVLFDSSAREIASPTSDSVTGASSSDAPGSVSAALIVAVRAAARLERERDSVEIMVISPVIATELDAATAVIRRTWHGPVRVVRAGAAPNDNGPPSRPAVRAPGDDPVAVALAVAGPVPDGEGIRLVRDSATAADTAWAREGGVVIAWPSAAVATWPRRERVDTAFAVMATGLGGGGADGAARSATVVAPFVRTVSPPPGHVVARWSDGDPAATESALGSGCIRWVAVAVPAVGDLPLTPAFRRFARRLTGPCGHAGRQQPVSDSVLAAVLPTAMPGSSSGDPGPTVAAIGVEAPRSRLAAWLLALALLAAFGELWIRREESNAIA